MADIQIQRRIQIGIIKFHQHVTACNARLRATKSHKCRDIETAHADEFDERILTGKGKLTRVFIEKRALRINARARKQRLQFLENTAFGHGDGERL